MKIIYFLLILFGSKIVLAKTILLDKTRAKIQSKNIIILQSEIDEFMKLNNMSTDENYIVSKEEMERKIIDEIAIKKINLEIARRINLYISDQDLEKHIINLAKRYFPNLTANEARKALINEIQKQNIKYEKYRESIRERLTIEYVTVAQANQKITTERSQIEKLAEQLQIQGINNSEYDIGEIVINKSSPDSKNKINKTYQAIKDGADFRKLAISISEGMTSRKGGDWGYQKTSNLSQKIATAIEKTKKNQITEIIDNNNSYHIFKVYDIKKESKEYYVEYQIRNISISISPIISEANAKKKINNIYNKIKSGSSFEKMASLYSEDIRTSDAGGMNKWQTAKEMDVEYAKVVQNLKKQQYSKPFQDSKKNWCIIKLEDQKDNSNKIKQIYLRKAERILMQKSITEQSQMWINSIKINNKIIYL